MKITEDELNTLPKFHCPKCGKQLKVSKKIRDFDTKDGMPKYEIVYSCGNWFITHCEMVYEKSAYSVVERWSVST